MSQLKPKQVGLGINPKTYFWVFQVNISEAGTGILAVGTH